MSRLSLFILPVIAGVGTYFLILLLLPDVDQLVALLIALLTGWTFQMGSGKTAIMNTISC